MESFKSWLVESVQIGQEFTIPTRQGMQTVRVVKISGGNVWLWPYDDEPDKRLIGAIVMPLPSVMHFINDLNSKVDISIRSGDHAIDAVLDGNARFLGKGDDGLAFEVGDEIVKVSTTVPFVPTNPFHRSPSQAARKIHHEVASARTLSKIMDGILPYRFKVLKDKAFLVHPKVDIPERLSLDQLKQVRNLLRQLHEAGWTYRDEIQIGLWNGFVHFYDLGKIKNQIDDFSAQNDMDYLERLYSRNGQEDQFVPVGRVLKDKWLEMTDLDGGSVWFAQTSEKMKRHLLENAKLYKVYIKEELPELLDRYQPLVNHLSDTSTKE